MEQITEVQTRTETSQPLSPREYYRRFGYFIFRGLIPSALIDSLLGKYKQDILHSNDHFLRQSSGRWERNRLSAHGYSEESFLNPHDFSKQKAYSEAVRNILCSSETRRALSELTGEPSHTLIQSMMFDQNTGTKAHQDWFYLDTNPSGDLLAGWFALEDIQEEAGRFFVIPGSHRTDFNLSADEKIANPLYLKRLQTYMKEHQTEMIVPPLRKGDVLFWNSGTIHGATDTIDSRYSRKSLTGHFVPSTAKVGRRYDDTVLKLELGDHAGMAYRLYPESNAYSIKARIKADAFGFLWKHPRLMRAARTLLGKN